MDERERDGPRQQGGEGSLLLLHLCQSLHAAEKRVDLLCNRIRSRRKECRSHIQSVSQSVRLAYSKHQRATIVRDKDSNDRAIVRDRTNIYKQTSGRLRVLVAAGAMAGLAKKNFLHVSGQSPCSRSSVMSSRLQCFSCAACVRRA